VILALHPTPYQPFWALPARPDAAITAAHIRSSHPDEKRQVKPSGQAALAKRKKKPKKKRKKTAARQMKLFERE